MIELASLTDLIHRASQGDSDAFRAVFDLTYEDLRALARMRLSRGGRNTVLDTTALVHESFLRFSAAGRLQLSDREHFMRYASRVMRSVIVDLARSNLAVRHGGDVAHISLATAHNELNAEGETQILRVHEALEELAHLDPRMAQVVEMRYFGGMTEAEIGAALDVGERTVRRDWEKARLLLARALL